MTKLTNLKKNVNFVIFTGLVFPWKKEMVKKGEEMTFHSCYSAAFASSFCMDKGGGRC